MNITVYLGSSFGNKDYFKEEIQRLGSWIGSHNHRLIYGGSKAGLMGLLAQSALESGAEVIGIEPQMFIDSELQYDGITELIITKDMPERKSKMIELGDVFITFPGGTGTLEEVSEVMSMTSLNLLDAPCIFYNLHGFYNPIKDMMDKMFDTGLCTAQRCEKIFFANTLEEIENIINTYYGR